jgi:predicted RNA-binding protein YlxR (DUF448 family)
LSEPLVLAEPDPGTRRPRRCVASRESWPREALLRFVVAPDGDLVADLQERLPGRGLWVRAERAALERAVRGRLFARAAGREVRVAPGLAQDLERALVGRCVDLIGLARRAGTVWQGFDQVEAALREGRVALLVQASDAAADGVRKLAGVARGVRVVRVLDRAEIGRALGREAAVHVALAAGGLADKFWIAAQRLQGFRRAPDEAPAGGEAEGTA